MLKFKQSKKKQLQWSDILMFWKYGSYPQYPETLDNRFIYETSICKKTLNNKYDERFIKQPLLNNIKKQNYEPFIEYIENSLDKYSTSFYNINKDTKLIIPIPRKNKNFSTIKDFMDNASDTHQKFFWKHVSEEIILFLTKNENVFVSTHGLGVHYFHIRLSKHPKYYKTTKFINQFND
jgi:hypothetical protein